MDVSTAGRRIPGDTGLAGRAAGTGQRRRAAASRALATVVSLLIACGDPVGIDPETVAITLEVTGGLAGVDFAIEVDGRDRVVRGTCESGCEFDDGEVLMGLSDFQVSDLAGELEDAGVFGYDGRDFGVQCCDQFQYRLTYDRTLRDAVLSGSSGALPEPVAAIAARLHALTRKRVPAIVDFSTTPAAWPADPLSVDSLFVDGSELTIHVTWGGGCEHHSIDLIAWNGFLESEPVQVGAVLAHDARNDMCDALISDTRRFDLTPLRDAWRVAYGPGPGTIIINLDVAGQPQMATATYTF